MPNKGTIDESTSTSISQLNELGPLTLGGFLTEVGNRYSMRQALVFAGASYTYRQLEEQVRQVARGLLANGVTKGTRVAILMSNRPEWVIAAYAIGMIGGISIPISTYAPEREREYILRHSDASVLLMQQTLLKHEYLHDLLHTYPELEQGTAGELRIPAFPYLCRVICIDPGETPASIQSWHDLPGQGAHVSDALLDAIMAEVYPSDDAMVIYTSGSTALPKGVLHMHRAPCIQSWRWAEQLRLTSEDRVWTSQPFFWTAGFSMSLGGTLAAGACMILQEWFDPVMALEVIETERVTTLHTWPHQDAVLAEHPDARRRDLTSLKNLPVGSLLRPLAGLTEDTWDPGAAYGLSETFTIATSIPSDSPAKIRQTTHGLPLPGMTLRIVDQSSGVVLPPGSLGEITVKGVTLMRGYYKVAPEECLDAEGFFHTKDAGYLDEQGYLHWTGRISNLIKTAGANVSPVEVEAELIRWGRLKAAFVVGVPHPTLGEAVVLCAVLMEDSPVSEEEVKSYLHSKLASYKVPRRVLFFQQEELSFTGTAKVKFAHLKTLAQERLRSTTTTERW